MFSRFRGFRLQSGVPASGLRLPEHGFLVELQRPWLWT